MRKSVLASLAALFLLCAGTTTAHAQATNFAPVSDVCTGPKPVTWKNWGGAPYASSVAEALSDKKLDLALKHAVDAGCMPQAVADALKAEIRKNPNGGTFYLTPEFHLNMMESRDHPMFNTTVGKTVIMNGVVRAAEARVWAVMYEGRLYNWFLPIVCRNYALQVTAPPAPAAPDCYVIAIANSDRDAIVDFSMHGTYAPSACQAYRLPGDTAWRPLPTRCPEVGCVPVESVNGLAVAQSGGWNARPGWTYLRVSAEQARVGVVYLCLKRTDGSTSCGLKVQRDDYRDKLAIVSNSKAAAIKALPKGARLLYWLFDPSQRCDHVD